ncbi:HAD family hydrolase [Vreelandella zhaodongensis]|uniref:phosphoglycolate phosphatase n=1 Tax=Vreelandella zhaodongensis TaxID=1176240 RepID=A0ABX2SMA4_VREZH|nr:HAD family hydrolase [Halomonas zhaodongensis]NYS43413.1 HAD hydrolase-like protein [Halomonas zhaodongensis]
MTKYKLNTPIKSFNTYVFDCDGVLLDSNRVKTDAFYNAVLPYGESVAQAFVDYHKANGGVSRQKKFEYFFLNILKHAVLPQEKYQTALDEYSKLTAEGLIRCEVLPGVRKFLTSLPSQAKKFVVSGGAQDEVRWVLEAKGLATFFDGIYGNPIDKLALVKNLELKDSDYPGVFFGDARYDHEVATKFDLDFIFLSAVSDFGEWKEYVEKNNLQAFNDFFSVIAASQALPMENDTAEVESTPGVVSKKRKAYFFGFPFSKERKSTFTGGHTIGPGVVNKLVEETNSTAILFTSSASHYVSWDSVNSVNQRVAFWDTAADSIVGVSDTEMQKYYSFLPTVQEMIERNQLARKKIFFDPKYQISSSVRKIAINKIAFWVEQVKNDNVAFYINSNVPHLADDYACYCVCRANNIPTAFPYRMPIVPGVSARLYIPESLYNHDDVYARNGQLISYNRQERYGDELPADLNLIYQEVVLGDFTLGTLSKEVLSRNGGQPPKQYTPPEKSKTLFRNVKENIINKRSWFDFFYAKQAYSTMICNKKEYDKLCISEIPKSPFVYYALHMQPEASSSPLGSFFADQLRAIRFISDNLPKGWKLLVKEHPHQKLEERPVNFYSDIMKSTNVNLISMKYSSDQLQEKSNAIATLTGTAAFEAWLKKKPALVLGNIIYQSAPGIYKIRSKGDIEYAFSQLKSGVLHKESDIWHYLSFLGLASFFGHLDAYIDPSIPVYDLDLDENEKEIGHRLSTAINVQANKLEGVDL